MSSNPLLFYYDFVSPNSYIARERLKKKRSDWNIEVQWKPVFFGGILDELDVPVGRSNPKARYMKRDMERWCDYYEIPFSMPRRHPIKTLVAMRGALVVRRMAPAVLEPYQDAVFQAYYVEGRDISKRRTLLSLVSQLDLDEGDFFERVQDPTIKQELKDRTRQALDRGVFGLPAMFVDDELFWGKDRFSWIKRALGIETSDKVRR